MANHKANEPRISLRVPVSFRDDVMKEAHAAGMAATDYLEGMDVVLKMTDSKHGVCTMNGCIERTQKGYKFCNDHMVEVKDKLVSSGNETEDSINEVLFW